MEIDLGRAGNDLRHDSYLLNADVCVVGAGIAGLTLAHKLAALGVDTLLLEAGGRDEVAEGSTADAVQVFGGTSSVWGGQVLPVGCTEGWPVRGEELARFQPEIESVLGVDRLGYEGPEFLSQFRDRPAQELVWLPQLHSRFSKFAPYRKRNLGRSLGRDLLRHAQARVVLHARVVDLQLAADGARVQTIVARTLSGAVAEITAKHFVLAAGTVETCRLLLNSNAVIQPGVGNQQGQVGRNCHDHLTVAAAVLEGRARRCAVEAFRPWIVGGLRGTVRSLKLEPSASRGQYLLPWGMAHFTFEEPAGTGIAALREMLRARQQGQDGSAVRRLGEFPRAVNDLFSLYACARREGRRYISPGARVALQINVAQRTPSVSRVRLSDEVDRFGARLAVLEWKVSPEDRGALRTWAQYLHDGLSQRGYAAADGAEWNPHLLGGDVPIEDVESARHAMGGACMGTDPRWSVVDGDLKVHGVDNLFVASAAVFPDGRAQLPTMTLMALCLRLADHLRSAVQAR